MSDQVYTRGCVICGRQFVAGERPVPTTSGEFVHVICADHQARVTYHRRIVQAIVSAGFGVGLFLLGKLTGMYDSWLLILMPLLLLAHILLNQPWWRLTIQSVRLRWRGRRGRR